MFMRPHLSLSRLSFLSVSLVLAALLGACAPTVDRKAGPQQELQLAFPAPPDSPRYYFERMIMSSADVVLPDEESQLKTLLTGAASQSAEPLGKPYAVAAHKGRVFVTDSSDRAIKVFDFPQRKFFKFRETADGGLAKPLGLDVDQEGNVYVADASKKGVYVFDREGNYLRRLGETKLFDRLTSVTVDHAGTRVYAVDIGGVQSDRHRVVALDAKTGAHLFDIGKRGAELGNFNLPRDLAVGNGGNLYVVDGGNFRVQVFDKDGKYLNSWGKVGKQMGDFARPKEIATDREGNVYVVDAAFGNFQIFSPDGELLMFIGERGEGNAPARYMLPSGVFVDEDGRVYMVDQWFRKIDVFRPASLKENEGYLVLGNEPGASPAAKK